MHYYRGRPEGLPSWLEEFVATGYQHYATQLPQAFQDRGTHPSQVAGMLGFVFTLESLALAMGCRRSQILVAAEQAARVTTDHEKVGLLWAAEWLLDLRDTVELRREFGLLLDNPLSVRAFPAHLSGFLLALGFTSRVAELAVELLGRAFSELPDSLLMPWLPGLLDSLRPSAGDVLPALLKEASRSLPPSLAELDAWTAPWEAEMEAEAAAPAVVELGAEEAAARLLLFAHRETAEAAARTLDPGAERAWSGPLPAAAPVAVPRRASAR